MGFVAIVPYGFRGSSEAAISIARLFAAGVLLLIGTSGVGGRLRWVASGFVVLGFGQLLFGYLAPILETTVDVNDSLYQMILVRSLAGALMVIGLVPANPPRFNDRSVAWILAICAGSIAVYGALNAIHAVPTLVSVESLEMAARLQIAPMSWMTGWHWVLAILPLGLAMVASVGAEWRTRERVIGGWLPVAIILLAGSELHDALWPSAYGNSVIMNTADLLRLAMAAVVVVGGTRELQQIAAERQLLLAAEQDRSQRLEELISLKADFTAMVAHELGHPLSAIRRLTEMLAQPDLGPTQREYALSTILSETDALDRLVADMQTTTTVERADFKVSPLPVAIADLLSEAVEFFGTRCCPELIETRLRGLEPGQRVLADPLRIGQVLRNLLDNAVKYSPTGTPIILQVAATGNGRARFEVCDHGHGIYPDDRDRIFEKFGRGRERYGRTVSGTGLGLYLSRRIVRAHGSELTVRSEPGSGAVFNFELMISAAARAGWQDDSHPPR